MLSHGLASVNCFCTHEFWACNFKVALLLSSANVLVDYQALTYVRRD